MRLLSGLLSVASVAAFGFACGAFALTYVTPVPKPFVAPQRAAALDTGADDTRDLPQGWPAVFGVIPEPEPEPESEPEPEPEVFVELPPEENTTYYLTGLVAGRGAKSWAMISEKDRGFVVRVGDILVGGETVVEITAEGVLIDYDGERQLIPVNRSELSNLVWREPLSEADRQPSPLLAEVTVPVEGLDRDYITGMFDAAGRLAASRSNGLSEGMEIVWMERGQFFDQIGLRTGDRILRVNGSSVATENLLVDIPDDGIANGSLDLEIMRDGTRQTLKVTLDKG